MAHALAHFFESAARGDYPAADGGFDVVPSPGGSADALIGFTGHFVLAADIEAALVGTMAPPGDFSVPLSASFLTWVGTQIGSAPMTQDALLVATAIVGEPSVPLTLIDDVDHPRVRRANRYRRDVRMLFASIDHSFHNTSSCLRTMELLLGLPPMCQYDAIASPIMNWDTQPSNAEPATIKTDLNL